MKKDNKLLNKITYNKNDIVELEDRILVYGSGGGDSLGFVLVGICIIFISIILIKLFNI